MSDMTEWAITDAFRCLENGDVNGFFGHVAEDVEWTVMGAHPLAGTYYGRTAMQTGSLLPMKRDLRDGAAIRIRHQLISGDHAVVEAETIPTDYERKREPYRYCWSLDVEDGVIVRGRAYVDPGLVTRILSG